MPDFDLLNEDGECIASDGRVDTLRDDAKDHGAPCQCYDDQGRFWWEYHPDKGFSDQPGTKNRDENPAKGKRGRPRHYDPRRLNAMLKARWKRCRHPEEES